MEREDAVYPIPSDATAAKPQHGIYFFTGEDELRKNLSIDKVKTKLSLSSGSFDYNTYYGKEASVQDIIDGLKTLPLLGKKRLIILKEAEKLSEDDKKKLISYLKKPAKTSVFIITTKKPPNAADILNAAAKRCAVCADFAAADESDSGSVFKLMDEISLKRKKPALQRLISLMQSGKNAHEILGLIAWYIRRLGKAKILLRKGARREEIADSLKVSHYTAQNIINQAKNFTFTEIKEAQQSLIETDIQLKRSVSKPEVLLEMLIMRLSG